MRVINIKEEKKKKKKKSTKRKGREINPKLLKAFKIFLLTLLVYLVVAPFLPELNYQIRNILGLQYKEERVFSEDYGQEIDEDDEEIGRRESRYKDFDLSGNRIVIPTIGVHIGIVEGEDDSVLYRGAWRRPNSSTPDQGGNTVITGHRFHYIPPNNQTFYNLNKLANNSKVFIFWNEKEYIYQVYESFIVQPEQTEIEGHMDGNILTLYTCHPIWTADQRLVVRAKLLEVRD